MTQARWDVVGLGENSVDHVLRLPRLPAAGSAAKVEISRSLVAPGGQVVTTMCTCAALGLRTSYIGALGTDANAALLREVLLARGIHLGDAVSRDAPNRSAVILVHDRTGDRIVLWQRDAALALRPADVPVAAMRHARVVHVDGVDEDASVHAARLAREAGAHVCCDLDGVGPRTGALLAEVTIPILAEGLPEAVTGESDPERALRKLPAPAARLRCVTLGSRGAILLDGDRAYHAPAVPVDAVDTTGAGDVFRGAFIVALLRGDAPGDMLRFATAAAAVACTRIGAIGGVPTIEEVEALMNERRV